MSVSNFSARTTRMSRSFGRLGAAALCAALGLPSHAQTVQARPAAAVRMLPMQPATPTPGAAAVQPGAAVAPAMSAPAAPLAKSPFTPEETADLKEMYTALSKEDKAEMRAAYLGMGVDLEAIFGPDAAATGVQPPSELVTAVTVLDFARTPKAVLSARSQLGFGQTPAPDPRTAKAPDLAKWLHLHVMAGDWDAFAAFLTERPAAEAEALYAHVLQSMNKGDPGLLPEEILAIAEAVPGEIKDWQLETLSKLLQAAAGKYSTGPLLAQLKAGTKLFGGEDPAKRKRVVDFLAGAGMAVEAYAYLPSLEAARAENNASVILNHGRYHAELHSTLSGPEAESHLLTAWNLLTEASLMPEAPFPVRQDAMRRAIDLLPHIPPTKAKTWFAGVFESPAIAPAALEIVALKAMTIGEARLDVEQRAQTILTMKEAVDTLLAHESVDIRTVRIPLRMLTTALVAEAEAAITDKAKQRVIARETQLLLRALPGDRWLDAIEPSLSARASKAFIAIATIADKTDQALEILAGGIARSPDQAADMADHFLQNWEKRLNPQPDENQENYFYFGYRQMAPAAPVTRGRQRRNLDRLKSLIATLQPLGIEARQLPSVTAVFKACHARTEVFDKGDIARVFGPPDQIPAATSSALAAAMRASLAGDWRNREAQRVAGMNRTGPEITELVDKGYGVAIDLIDSALAAEPDSWRHAIVKASLSYDRMQFKQTTKKQEPAKYDAYRKDAFAAFAQAADQYRKVVERGESRDDAGVYQGWFAAAIADTELNYLNRDDGPTDGSLQEDQIDLIRAAIMSLPKDAADRHLSAFARAVEGEVGGAPPEVKPRLVRHAMRIVADHPAGAALRATHELYQDLVKDEIKLRMTVDGDDRVGVGRPFGVLLTLRFTTAVDRETGGFSKYLQNDVFARVGNQYRSMNYRDQLKKAVEESLGKDFDIESVGFFEPLTPSRAVSENGEDGWQEKPMAYIVLKRRDPSVDRLPQVAMDMYFNDPTGAVTLSLPSNTPQLVTGEEPAPRPVRDLKVAQTVDLRRLQSGEKDRAVSVEIVAKGKGIVPELTELLAGLDAALPGYTIAEKGIETRPALIQQNDSSVSSRFNFYGQDPEPPKEGYPEADENGIYRLPVERSWVVTYTPAGGKVAPEFRLPILQAGIAATLTSRHYADMDILEITGPTLAVVPRLVTTQRAITAVLVLALIAVAAVLFHRWRRGRIAVDGSTDLHLPDKITPLSVITTLRRLRVEHAAALNTAHHSELASEIDTLERRYFGPGNAQANGDLKEVLTRWSATVRKN